ncbi:hypothetical protein [uncultured Thermosynechococcus sp.]|nr:hypothetical protein [uncultured Thermosynechococcus sp.]
MPFSPRTDEPELIQRSPQQLKSPQFQQQFWGCLWMLNHKPSIN